MLFFANIFEVQGSINSGLFRFDGTIKTAVKLNQSIVNPEEYSQGKKAQWGYRFNMPQYAGEEWITSLELIRRLRFFEVIIIWSHIKEMIKELRMLWTLKKTLKKEVI
ncbi:MAG: hypothetical protein Q8P56_01460 [Candidatus Uhrbacteria bacterium]|nr:hypothetical protein [Candidatus Uhrbacteria bacterium]